MVKLHGEGDTGSEEDRLHSWGNQRFIYNYNANKHMQTSILYLEIVIHLTPYMNGGATTPGVFKAHAFFLHLLTSSIYQFYRFPLHFLLQKMNIMSIQNHHHKCLRIHTPPRMTWPWI